ncbi:uncharacterized protein LOC121265149 [Juglans microcarpa x Juglans regia]|uniref:uncharacterized protein LOC121265149 n=1 Tax=Juglans microcarpa x Juglans regia TaxID=2249226 RepID=UPI001B7E1717|nr:uncharacterized protein LOC121265149 [Juglans microcarpa x Juglans regia]
MAAVENVGRRFVDLVSVVPQPLPELVVSHRAPKTKDGELFFQFSKEEIFRLAEPFRFSIVLKFLRNRPSLDAIRIFIRNRWSLEGVPVVSTMRHPINVFVRMASEEDCMRALSREACDIDWIPYCAFHWTPDFKEEEPSIVPVWIELPDLPPNFYHESFLKILTIPIGRFIRRDNPTQCATRTDGARICVEMDAAIEPLSHFWIGTPGLGSSRKQDIVYETLPAFCSKCKIQGHNVRTCRARKKRPENLSWVRQQETVVEDQEPVVEEPKEPVIAEAGVADQTKLVQEPKELTFPSVTAEKETAENITSEINLVLRTSALALLIEGLDVDKEHGEVPNTEGSVEARQNKARLERVDVLHDSVTLLREAKVATETLVGDGSFNDSEVYTEQRVDDQMQEDVVCLEEGSLSDPEPDIHAEVFPQNKDYHTETEEEAEKRKGLGTSMGRLKSLISKFKPKMVVLLEPFQSFDKAHYYMRALHFDNVISNDKVGGKIWVLWMNDLVVNVIRMTSQFLSLSTVEGDFQFLGNFIYAKCNMMDRRILWEDLRWNNLSEDPYLFAGDFNIIHSDLERRGGRSRSIAAMDDFNKWIHEGGLIDLNSHGSKFSWCNGQRGLAKAWAKLDRVLLDANLMSIVPNVTCSYLPRMTSDHCPMLIEFLKDPYSYDPSPFRFQQMWVEHPEFIDFVKSVWSVPVVGMGLFKLANRLKRVKVALREWNKRVFGRTNAHIASLEVKVEGLEGSLQREWDIDAERELVVASAELSTWRRREDIRLAQMAKIKWNKEGDRNSKFFHVWLANKRCKRIQGMRTSDGIEFNSPEEIHNGAVDYFADFFKNTNQLRAFPDLSHLISPVIEEVDCTCLCCIPSLEEVKEALSSIPINSSPGPNCFGAGSFKSCWEVIKMDVLEAISEFFLSKKLLRFYSASFIVLIPKIDVPTGFLPKLIFLEQGAFIPERSIFENISITQEMVHSLNKVSHGGNIMIKVDMAKTYDQMDKSWMNLGDRLVSPAYAEGVNNFLTMARNHSMESDRIRCPCRICCNNLFLPIFEVENHFFIKGINPNYTQWIFHGKEETLPTINDDTDPRVGVEDEYIDDMNCILDDIRAGTIGDAPENNTASPTHPSIPQPSPNSTFDQLLEVLDVLFSTATLNSQSCHSL